MTIDSVISRQVLTPLSKATSTLLEPIKLFANDYLELELDKTLRWFVSTAISYRPYSGVLSNYYTEADIVDFNGRMWLKDGSASGNAAQGWVKKVPEKSEIGFGKWRLAATDFTALIISQNWPENKLIFRSEEAEMLYRLLLQRFAATQRQLELAAHFKHSQNAPVMPADYIPHSESPLLPYQQVGLLMSLMQPAFALFMEQGTGKTGVTVSRWNLEAMRKRNGPNKQIYKTLVICPNQVRSNWTDESAKFSVVPGKVTVIRGGIDQRRRLLLDAIRHEDDCLWGTAIIGVDSVESTLEVLKMVAWDLIVVDEAHLLKNSRTSRWKAASELRGVYVRQVMLLTGTPIANTIMDLWAQFELMGEGYSGFMSFANFKKFYGVYIKQTSPTEGTSIEKLVSIKNVPLIQERLARLSFMITKKDANLQLPDIVEDVIEVTMTPVQATWYKTIKDQLVLELKEILDGTEGPRRIMADHVLTKLLRLAQITSGNIRWDEVIDIEGKILAESRTEAIPGPNPKLDALQELWEDEGRDPLGKKIIWATFVADIHSISTRLTTLGIKHVLYHGEVPDKDRDKVIYQFNNDPDTKVLVGTQATAGTGTNLLGYPPERPDSVDTYVDHVIIISQGWQPVLRSQSIARAHRKGARCPNLRITDVVVPGTVDEEIRDKVRQKVQTATQIQDLREILKNVLEKELV